MKTAPGPAVVARPGDPGWVGAVCFVLCAVSIGLFPVNHDVSWLLSLAGRIRHGERLYTDIVEVSPPLIAWLNLPAALAADVLALDPERLFRTTVLGLALGSAAISVRLARGRLALAPLCVALIAAAGYDFGQREHLALIFSLPYLAVGMLRFQGQHTSRRLCVAVAIAAAVGFSIKPHFLLAPAAVELLIAARWRRWPGASCWALGIGVLVYGAAILLFAPGYLRIAGMLTRIYAVGLLGISPWALLFEPNFYIGIAGVLLALRLRPPGFAVLLAAALGFAGAALLQLKGWSYHWYPFAALGWMLAFSSAGAVFSRVAVDLGTAVLCAAAVAIAWVVAPAKNPYLPLLEPVVRELGGGSTLVLSSTVRVSYPLLARPGITNASRLPVAQLLFASIVAGKPRDEADLRRIVVEDLVAKRPNLLIEERRPRGLPAGFDSIQYLSQEPAFARAMQGYVLARVAGPFRIYRREPPETAPGASSATAAGRDNPARGSGTGL